MSQLSLNMLALLACASITGAAAQSPASAERLLAEPLWILRANDGMPVHVWFAQETDGLAMLRCGAGTPACRADAARAGSWRALGGSVYVTPEGALLYPAWMVPAAGSLAGH